MRIRIRSRRCARSLRVLRRRLRRAPALAQEAPDALVKRVAGEVLADHQVRSRDPGRRPGARSAKSSRPSCCRISISTRMTALAMGRNWRKATPEQQKQLTDEFRALLVRTYSGALNQYRDQTIDYKPLRDEPGRHGRHRAHARSCARARRRCRSTTAWRRRPTAGRCYDVIVGGVSLVTNYRDEFNEQIKTGGVDGLIKTLAERTRASPASERRDCAPRRDRQRLRGGRPARAGRSAAR